MAGKRIRFGVAGLGRIGWEFHAPQAAEHEAFDFVAVQDVLPERVREAEQRFGVRGFADFGEMLAQAHLEAVAIATPTHLHKPMALAALRAGCHLIVEKPFASDATEAGAIVRAAKRADRLLTVYQPRRAVAYFQHVKQLIASGLLGNVYHVFIGEYDYARRSDWQSLRKFGGGMLSNYGAHALDQLLQLCGYDIRRVFCNLRAAATLGDAEDVVKVIFETRRGVTGEIDINQASPLKPNIWYVWGTLGALSLSEYRDRIRIRRFTPDQLPPKQLDRRLAAANREYIYDRVPFIEEEIPVDRNRGVDFYANFAAALREGAPLFVKPKEPLAVMKLIDRCREDSGRILKTR